MDDPTLLGKDILGEGKGMIHDEFSSRYASRQRRYQLRQRALGRCVNCGGASGGPKFCTECNSKERFRVKLRKWLKEVPKREKAA